MTEKKIVFRKSLSNPEEYDPTPMLWVKEFDFESAIVFSKVISELDADESVKEIFLYVSSYGGEALPLLAMLDTMLACSTPINSVVLGTASSCGAILAACAPGTRFIGPESTMLLHHARGGMQEDLPGMEQELKAMAKVESKLFKLIAKRSGFTVTALRNKIKEENREWHLSAKDALEFGLVDHIGVPRLSSSIIVECEV